METEVICATMEEMNVHACKCGEQMFRTGLDPLTFCGQVFEFFTCSNCDHYEFVYIGESYSIETFRRCADCGAFDLGETTMHLQDDRWIYMTYVCPDCNHEGEFARERRQGLPFAGVLT